MRQRPAGVTRIVTVVTVDNAAALAMLQRLGPCRATPTGHGVLEVVVDLPAATRVSGKDVPASGVLRRR